VYAASAGGEVAALSETTGSSVWSATVAGVSGAPGLGSSGHTLMVPTNASVAALNTATGAPLWSFPVTAPTSPLVQAGVVYVGSSDHHVYAVSAASGQQLWSFATGGAIQDSGALINSVQTSGVTRLYIGSNDGLLYSLDASTGKKLAAYPMGANVTGVGIVGNAVLVTTSSGLVRCVRTFGSTVWDYATDGMSLRPPALADGTFFAAGVGGTLWAFTPYGAPPQ
jgi:serine/threonine-protein kinase